MKTSKTTREIDLIGGKHMSELIQDRIYRIRHALEMIEKPVPGFALDRYERWITLVSVVEGNEEELKRAQQDWLRETHDNILEGNLMPADMSPQMKFIRDEIEKVLRYLEADMPPVALVQRFGLITALNIQYYKYPVNIKTELRDLPQGWHKVVMPAEQLNIRDFPGEKVPEAGDMVKTVEAEVEHFRLEQNRLHLAWMPKLNILWVSDLNRPTPPASEDK